MDSDMKVSKTNSVEFLLSTIGDWILKKEKRKLSDKMLLIKRKKKPGLKSNPGLVLIGLRNNWAPVFFRVQ